MKQDPNDGILRNLVPLAPIPTGEVDSGELPAGIKAVLFDVYGTLLVSGTGDIGIAFRQQGAFGLASLLEEWGCGGNPDLAAREIPGLLERFIRTRHEELRAEGVDYPEVEIRSIWKKVLASLWEEGLLDAPPGDEPTDDLAMGYELEVNPVWLMPGFPEIVRTLSEAGFRIGIVSNAQFYTPLILEALAGASLAEMGFEKELCAWSFESSYAKPSPRLFSGPITKLSEDGVEPKEILYVGNDMLNDVYAAATAGCRTCLFAGDKRSLRRREGDKRASVAPDMTITDLSRLESLTETGATDG